MATASGAGIVRTGVGGFIAEESLAVSLFALTETLSSSSRRRRQRHPPHLLCDPLSPERYLYSAPMTHVSVGWRSTLLTRSDFATSFSLISMVDLLACSTHHPGHRGSGEEAVRSSSVRRCEGASSKAHSP